MQNRSIFCLLFKSCLEKGLKNSVAVEALWLCLTDLEQFLKQRDLITQQEPLEPIISEVEFFEGSLSELQVIFYPVGFESENPIDKVYFILNVEITNNNGIVNNFSVELRFNQGNHKRSCYVLDCVNVENQLYKLDFMKIQEVVKNFLDSTQKELEF